MGCFLTALIMIAISFGAACLEGWVVMMLWNWLVPMLFNGPTISFWVSVGICFLISILFGTRISVNRS